MIESFIFLGDTWTREASIDNVLFLGRDSSNEMKDPSADDKIALQLLYLSQPS